MNLEEEIKKREEGILPNFKPKYHTLIKYFLEQFKTAIVRNKFKKTTHSIPAGSVIICIMYENKQIYVDMFKYILGLNYNADYCEIKSPDKQFKIGWRL